MSNIFGIQVVVDRRMADAGTAGDPYVRFGHRLGMYAATQIRKLEAYRPESRFGDAVKGLYVYGHKVVDTSLQYSIDLSA